MTIQHDLAARLRHMTKTARMWGSPDELEAAAVPLTHLWLTASAPTHRFAQTLELWRQLGGPFAGDVEEHSIMRTRMWRHEESQSRTQVVTGYTAIWVALERDPVRGTAAEGWVDALLREPTLAGTPDRLNVSQFALVGFASAEPTRFIDALTAQRLLIGGHELRPLPIVAPPGPNEASLTYGRNFTTWKQVAAGIERVLTQLEAPVA